MSLLLSLKIAIYRFRHKFTITYACQNPADAEELKAKSSNYFEYKLKGSRKIFVIVGYESWKLRPTLTSR
jgi:hypothetical protein